MGAYTGFLDLALGLASRALGLVASGAGLGAVFFASTLIVLCAAVIAVRLLYAPLLSGNAVGLRACRTVSPVRARALWDHRHTRERACA